MQGTQMKPSFLTLKQYHHSSEPTQKSYLSRDDLYQEIGYVADDLIKQNPGYKNTCATRMSMALLKSGVHFAGRIKIKSGNHKNRMIEPGAKLLADQLSKPSSLGRPLVITDTNKVATLLKNKKGIIFFWKIEDYEGGHIDLIETTNTGQICNSHCYFKCKEVWFWALP